MQAVGYQAEGGPSSATLGVVRRYASSHAEALENLGRDQQRASEVELPHAFTHMASAWIPDVRQCLISQEKALAPSNLGQWRGGGGGGGGGGGH